MTTRIDIVKQARSYLEVPWHHMGRTRDGVDCAGLLICVGRDLGLVPSNFDVPNYLREPDGHSLIEWCDQYLGIRVPRNNMKPGDVVVVKGIKHPRHLGIIGDYIHGGLSVIHSACIVHPMRVIETRLVFLKGMQFVGAYKFPGIED